MIKHNHCLSISDMIVPIRLFSEMLIEDDRPYNTKLLYAASSVDPKVLMYGHERTQRKPLLRATLGNKQRFLMSGGCHLSFVACLMILSGK